MNRVASRSMIVLALVLVLFAGTVFFVVEYAMDSGDWVMTSGSPHVYEGERVGPGVITDSDGKLILDMSDGRTYSKDQTTRESFLHWVGDREGNVNSSAISHYAQQLVGYDVVGGVYSYGDTTGRLKLTLDGDIQNVALKAMEGRKGTLAIYNYETGEIICAVSTPGFDPDAVPDIAGDTSGAYDGAYMNRFLRSKYIPGSIFKIVTLAAALESIPGVEEQTFTCTGSVQYGVDAVTCESVHGTQTLKEAFCNSCNCAFGELTVQLGEDRMMRYVEQFGLIDPISFDGLHTVAGNYDVTDAADQSLAWSGIGQYTDQINPCAFVRFVGAIGNDGVVLQPYVVDEVRVGSSKTYSAKTEKVGRIMSVSTAKTLAEYMGNNVTAKYGAEKFPELAVCAKSGTGEVGGDRKPNAMFTGFVNDADLPLAFIVCIEDGGYGAHVCIPVLSQVLESCKENVG